MHTLKTWDAIWAQIHHLVYIYQEASKYSTLRNKVLSVAAVSLRYFLSFFINRVYSLLLYSRLQDGRFRKKLILGLHQVGARGDFQEFRAVSKNSRLFALGNSLLHRGPCC